MNAPHSFFAATLTGLPWTEVHVEKLGFGTAAACVRIADHADLAPWFDALEDAVAGDKGRTVAGYAGDVSVVVTRAPLS